MPRLNTERWCSNSPTSSLFRFSKSSRADIHTIYVSLLSSITAWFKAYLDHLIPTSNTSRCTYSTIHAKVRYGLVNVTARAMADNGATHQPPKSPQWEATAFLLHKFLYKWIDGRHWRSFKHQGHCQDAVQNSLPRVL